MHNITCQRNLLGAMHGSQPAASGTAIQSDLVLASHCCLVKGINGHNSPLHTHRGYMPEPNPLAFPIFKSQAELASGIDNSQPRTHLILCNLHHRIETASSSNFNKMKASTSRPSHSQAQTQSAAPTALVIEDAFEGSNPTAFEDQMQHQRSTLDHTRSISGTFNWYGYQIDATPKDPRTSLDIDPWVVAYQRNKQKSTMCSLRAELIGMITMQLSPVRYISSDRPADCSRFTREETFPCVVSPSHSVMSSERNRTSH